MGLFNLAGAALQGAQQSAAARKNRIFQRKMRATQYQTAVKDMRLAGLNPMLAYKQGGAGNLSGAVAQVPDYGGAAGRDADQIRQVRKDRNEQERQKSLATQQITLMGEQAGAARTLGELNQSTANLKDIEGELAALRVPAARLEAELAELGGLGLAGFKASGLKLGLGGARFRSITPRTPQKWKSAEAGAGRAKSTWKGELNKKVGPSTVRELLRNGYRLNKNGFWEKM